jgi:hypothetical protein
LVVSWYVFSIGDAPGARLFRLAIVLAKVYVTISGSFARPSVRCIDAERKDSLVSSSSIWAVEEHPFELRTKRGESYGRTMTEDSGSGKLEG